MDQEKASYSFSMFHLKICRETCDKVTQEA